MNRKYEDSAEFTDELMEVSGAVDRLYDIVTSERWVEWMRATDNHFNTSTRNLSNIVLVRLMDLRKAVTELDNELLSAE